jgi:hypothetical protein
MEMTITEALVKMLVHLDEGTAVLTGREIHPDIPTIHDVGHQEGRRLRTDGEVKHLGFGCFVARVSEDRVSFDGGGAMYHAESTEEQKERWSYGFGWTLYRGPRAYIEKTGYDFDAVTKAVVELLEEIEAGE